MAISSIFMMAFLAWILPVIVICLFTFTMAYKTHFKPQTSWRIIVSLCVSYVLIGLIGFRIGSMMISSV